MQAMRLEGSSPLVRGKGRERNFTMGTEGIIPARAGKSAEVTNPKPTAKDHPRSCGEKLPSPVILKSARGSSPLVRGKAHSHSSISVRLRIIPARAGKRVRVLVRVRLMRDHPRSCGEKARSRAVRQQIRGSSPLVRGKAWSRASKYMQPGIIPARAGKSFPIGNQLIRYRDHPRSCGEKMLPA